MELVGRKTQICQKMSMLPIESAACRIVVNHAAPCFTIHPPPASTVPGRHFRWEENARPLTRRACCRDAIAESPWRTEEGRGSTQRGQCGS